MKNPFSDLMFMFSFLFQSFMKIYGCPKRFSNFFENHRALSRGKVNNSNSVNEYQINFYQPQLTPYEH